MVKPRGHHGSPVPESVPGNRMSSVSMIDTPDGCASREYLDFWWKTSHELSRRRRSGELGHYRAAASSAAASGGLPPRSHSSGVSGRSSSSRVLRSGFGLLNH